MDIVSRLKQYIDYTGLQNSQVADMAGIPRPTLSQLLTGRNKKVSNELIEKLHQAFPALNVLWLLFGDGDMETDANTQFSARQNCDFSEEKTAHDAENMANSSASLNDFDPMAEISKKIENKFTTETEPQEVQAVISSGRRVQSIMVFYSDNSFEVFEPSRKSTD
ncbi:MAG: helix-turn-helix domain-containing protein [Muribaculaceae bacterium]|nr:helix-turn-helix domain-containing protein [Muribaculaceae bacterium]